METLEAIKAKHAAEIAQAEKIETLADELPARPDRLTAAYDGHYWATYKCATPADVAALMRQFAPLIIPTIEIRDGCLYRLPLELLPARMRDRTDGRETIAALTTDQGRGFGVCVKFDFFSRTQSGAIIRVICELPDNARASATMTRPSYDRHGDPLGDGSAAPNPILRGLFHDHISWSPNVRGQDARYTYTLTDDAPGYSEILGILENSEITNWWK